MKLISGLCGLIIFLLAVAFALSNRDTATISLWPFDTKIDTPLYLLTLGTFFAGLLLGSFFAWVSMVPHHLKAARMRKEMTHLQEKYEALQRAITPSQPSPGLLLAHPKRRFGRWRR